MHLNFSLLEELRKVQEDRENGVLVLSRKGERLSITYREGIIQSASSSLGTHRLGTYLIQDGFLTERDVLKVAEEARKKKIYSGEAAVRKQYLEPRELAEIIRRQALDLLSYALDEGFLQEGFNKEIRPSYVPATINVAHILLEMSRSNPVMLDCVSTAVFSLKNRDDLSGVPWLPKELSVLGELSTPSSIETLKRSTGLDEPALRQILAVFMRLGITEEIGEPDEAESQQLESADLVKHAPYPFERLVPVVNAVFSEELEITKNPLSFISEQFKTLKVRIREDYQNPPRVLTISSPEQLDGKSLVSANFALTLAMESGRRTVIVDCDLRSPTLDKYLGVPSEPGLIQHLSNGRLSPYCHMRRIGNLYFMTSGGVSEIPTELLSLQKMRELVECLKKDFDTVILDAPPFSPVADARIVSGLSDGVIMVIRAGKTSTRSIENTFKVVDKKRLLGVVLNDVQPSLLSTYNDGYYYQYPSQKKSRLLRRSPKTTPKGYLGS